MSNCDENGERFLVKVAVMFNNNPQRFILEYEYSVTVLNKAPHNEDL